MLFVEHVVAVQLFPEAAAAAEHVCTGTLVVVTGAGHVVAVQLFPDVAAEAVQLATGTLVVLFGVHVVAV